MLLQERQSLQATEHWLPWFTKLSFTSTCLLGLFVNSITDKGHTAMEELSPAAPRCGDYDFSGVLGGTRRFQNIPGEAVPLHPHVISEKLCCLSEATFSSIKGCLELPKALLSSEEP